MDGKSAEEYLHWMQFLEYMPSAARETARKSFEKGEWPEVEIIPPRKEKHFFSRKNCIVKKRIPKNFL